MAAWAHKTQTGPSWRSYENMADIGKLKRGATKRRNETDDFLYRREDVPFY